MEVSPLTQVARPDVFQPKVLQLYNQLLHRNHESSNDTAAFWSVFFLLKTDRTGLRDMLDRLSSDDFLERQHETQQLFEEAILAIKTGEVPVDENALDTLSVFLSVILLKRFTNPSADIITVISGLDDVDTVFQDFATVLEATIRVGRTVLVRHKAIMTALALTAGAFQTSLVSYLTHKDLYGAIIRFIKESNNAEYNEDAFLLLGLLASYNKFEFRNPYRVHIQNCVDSAALTNMVVSFGCAIEKIRNQYIAIQEDVTEGWTLGTTLSYIGLNRLTASKPQNRHLDETKGLGFGDLPDENVAILQSVCECVIANKLFCRYLITTDARSTSDTPPFIGFLSFTSYLLHHAYRSARATAYSLVCLNILRLLIEDLNFCKILCDTEAPILVRLCRQRQPFLPVVTKPRPRIASILDIIIDTINHNLRRRLDFALYTACFGLLHRIFSYLAFIRAKTDFHWSHLWQCLISFLRFVNTYCAKVLLPASNGPKLFKPLLEAVALCVTSGESFLPNAAAYDDLFYKLVGAADILQDLRSHVSPVTDRASALDGNSGVSKETKPIDVLIIVAKHHQGIVQKEQHEGRLGNNPSPREVSKIIRKGYETLDLPTIDGLDRWNAFREADERTFLKGAARIAVDDTKNRCKNVSI